METYIRMGDSIGCASSAPVAACAKPTPELPGQVMQQASAYSAAKVMDMQKLVHTIMGARANGSNSGGEKGSPAVQRWSHLRQATLQNKQFVSLLTDADDTKAQEALEDAEAVGGTVEVESDSDTGIDASARS